MGACTSSPQSEALQGVETNQSPIHAEATQVKEKTAQDDAKAIDSDDQPNTASAPAASTDSPSPDTDLHLAANDDSSIPLLNTEKVPEETKESSPVSVQPVDRRPSSASQKQSARGTTPRTTNATAVSTVAPATDSSLASSDPFTSASSSSQFNAADAEFRATVKQVLVLLLDRFTRTLEYEKAAFQELAVAVGYANYMQLFDYEAFEAFLRQHYVIPSSPAPHQDDNDLRYLSQYFALFLNLAQTAPSTVDGGRVLPSREEMTVHLQKLCSETSVQLMKWCQSTGATVEVKEHLTFFSKALEFTRGDLVNNPQLLYKNIDDICE